MTGFTYGRAEGGSPALTRAYRFEKDMLIQTLTGKHPKFYWASHVQLAAGGFVRGVCSCAGPQRQSRASPPGGAKTGTRRISRVRPGHN